MSKHEVQQRDFSSFKLGDNPNELAEGLMYAVFDHMSVVVDPMDSVPVPEEYDALIAALGRNKVLRESHPAVSWDPNQLADLIEASGLQKPLNRSLWNPDLPTPDSAARFATDAVANQQDRIVATLADHVGDGSLWVQAGNRVMDSVTEKPNPHIQDFYEQHGRYPTGAEYAGRYVLPHVVEAGYSDVHFQAQPTSKGDEIMLNFVNKHPALTQFRKELAVVRVANAGVMQALQLRKAATLIRPSFDHDRQHPQLFVLTDTLPVARTEEQAADPTHFQKPETALQQLAVTGKLLAEAYHNIRWHR